MNKTSGQLQSREDSSPKPERISQLSSTEGIDIGFFYLKKVSRVRKMG
jgi:hypothetical protein